MTGFWRPYVAAILHYLWTFLVLGVGAIIRLVAPFLPTPWQHFAPAVGIGLAGAGIILAQTLAARRLWQLVQVQALALADPPASLEGLFTLDHPELGRISATSATRIELTVDKRTERNTFVFSPESAGRTLQAKGLIEPPDDMDQDPDATAGGGS